MEFNLQKYMEVFLNNNREGYDKQLVHKHQPTWITKNFGTPTTTMALLKAPVDIEYLPSTFYFHFQLIFNGSLISQIYSKY